MQFHDNVFPSELLKLLLEIKILDKDIPPFTPRPTGTLKSFFRGEKYLNAKMKNMKVYTEQELKSPQSELERKRRRFWNDKAEQLAKSPKTSHCNKTTLAGIIDVSWTLRKTGMIEGDARKLIHDEKELCAGEDEVNKLGKQKKETLAKNLERMAAAHAAVETLDAELEKCKQSFQMGNISVKEKSALKAEYNGKKDLMDGAYTELKRAQEASVKAIKIKRQQLDVHLSKKEEEEAPEESLTL